ncbi:hypothetical protein ACFOW6_07575 [Fodinicurvata halophila]|uniref:Uncharacterized protein n=1 Tax=Fodinicurvata halophila TaxID=1419723 RepID=A0ABV8UJG2_9PROT
MGNLKIDGSGKPDGFLKPGFGMAVRHARLFLDRMDDEANLALHSPAATGRFRFFWRIFRQVGTR